MYTCAICNKQYETIQERNACEAKCLAEKEREENREKRKALDAKKEQRRNEIENDISDLQSKIDTYVDDYGVLSLGQKSLLKKQDDTHFFGLFDDVLSGIFGFMF